VTTCEWCRDKPAQVLVRALVGVGPSKFRLCDGCLSMIEGRQAKRDEKPPLILSTIGAASWPN